MKLSSKRINRNFMKSRLESIGRYFKTIVLLLTMFMLECGCVTSKPTPDPLAGWRFSSLNNLHSNKAVSDDYQDYIQKHLAKNGSFVGSVDFFEDGTGQHAVLIKMGVNGTWWDHVLIYDKANKRINVLIHKNGGYRS